MYMMASVCRLYILYSFKSVEKTLDVCGQQEINESLVSLKIVRHLIQYVSMLTSIDEKVWDCDFEKRAIQ